MTLFREERFSGPIPHGGVLRSIDSVVPGAAADIVAEAHANMRSDRENESKFVAAVTALDLRGQWMAFTLAVLFGGASFTLFILHSVPGGIVMGIAAITPLVKAFLERGTTWSPWPSKDTDDSTDDP